MYDTEWSPRGLVRSLVPFSVLLLVAAGCGGGVAPAGPGDGGSDGGGATCDGLAPASLTDIYAATLAPNGAGGCGLSMCHGGKSTTGMNFTDAQSFYDITVGVASTEQPSLDRIVPGDPDHSYLYQKLLPSAGTRMPLGGPYLDTAAMNQLAGWICAGAPAPGTTADGGTPTDGGTSDGGTTDGGTLDGGSPDGGTQGPVITGLLPDPVIAGSGAFTLTVSGGGFTSGATVTVGSVAVPTTFVSASSVNATVDAALIADGGTVPVVVTDPAPVSAASLPADLVVADPVPAITALQPASVATGGAPFTLQITGASFVPSSSVTLDGSPVATTYVSATSLTAAMPSFQAPGSHAVAVVNPAPGGGTSASATLTAVATTGPTITGLSPASAAESTAFTLTVTGSGYACQGQKSTVTFGTATLTPATCTSTTLTVSVPGQTAGTYQVTVTNPGAGLTSNALAFDVLAPNAVPTLAAIAPTAVDAGSGAFSLAVTGTGFVAASTVDVDGSPRTTHFVTSTSLTADLTSADDTSAGTHAITVVNPAPGGGTSGSAVLTVNAVNPVPTVTSLSPCGTYAGAAAFTLTIQGSGFVAGATVTFGGTPVTVSTSGATSLSVTVPGSLVASPAAGDTVAVVVTNPAPGGGASSPASFGLASHQVHFAADVQPVFTASCAKTACHVTGAPATPMSLQAGQAYGNLVGVQSTECASRLRVLACGASPTQSYLVAKITDTDICYGSKMPKVGTLSAADIQLLTDWVAEGAPNN